MCEALGLILSTENGRKKRERERERERERRKSSQLKEINTYLIKSLPELTDSSDSR